MNKAMYILVNGDIKIKKGKLAGQVGHSVSTYIYRNFIRNYKNKLIKDNNKIKEIDDYMKKQTKIILKCSQVLLEKFESQGYITIRDDVDNNKNVITCVNYGIYDRDLEGNIPEEIKYLKLY